MKKIIVIAVVLLLSAGIVYAENYEVTKKAGDYTVTFKADKVPLVVGDNAATITIKDASGMDVTDASVELYCFMPSMPSMNSTASAAVEKAGYTAVIKPDMAGEWKFNVKFARPGEKAHKTTFTIKAQ